MLTREHLELFHLALHLSLNDQEWDNEARSHGLEKELPRYRNSLQHAISNLIDFLEERLLNNSRISDEDIDSSFLNVVVQLKRIQNFAHISLPSSYNKYELELAANAFIENFKQWHGTAKTFIQSKLIKSNDFRELNLRINIIDCILKLVPSYYDRKKDIRSSIVRSITFPPELKEAGTSVLSYFSHILNKKFPHLDVGVTIQQRNNVVTMIIDTPEGEKEFFEKELTNYGLVITGQLKPEDYLLDKHEVLALKHKLEIAELEVKHTRELLQSERIQHNERIKSLETQMSFLFSYLDKESYLKNQLSDALTRISESSTSNTGVLINEIVNLIKFEKLEDNEQRIRGNLLIVRDNDPSIYGKLNELFLNASIQGPVGNFFWNLIQSIGQSII